MASDIDFINDERQYWGKIFTDITYAISEVSPFVDEEQLRKRRYVVKIGVLKDYITMLDNTEFDSKKKSFFNMFKANDRIEKLRSFKQQNFQAFKQLENCSKCQCLNCSFECKFNGCQSCKEGSFLKTCDKEKFNLRCYNNFTMNLTNNDTGRDNKYKVLGTVENCELDKLYILLENVIDSSDKLVLYYYPGIKNDEFGEITDADEFDSVVEAYQEADY